MADVPKFFFSYVNIPLCSNMGMRCLVNMVYILPLKSLPASPHQPQRFWSEKHNPRDTQLL